MPNLEDELARLEAQVEDAQRAVKQLSAALARLRSASQSGNVVEVERGLAAIAQRGSEAAASAESLARAWTFDTRGYLANGFVEELLRAAGAAGLELIERDGRLSLFPVLLKIESGSLSLRIGKKLERRIRPAVLVRLLAAVQRKPQRLNEQRFLDLLYRAYLCLCGREWRGVGRGPVVELGDLHSVLTLLPSSDYGVDEFARDLLLLDRHPELRTKDGARPEFLKGTRTKGRGQRIYVYDEHGAEQLYVDIRFVKEG